MNFITKETQKYKHWNKLVEEAKMSSGNESKDDGVNELKHFKFDLIDSKNACRYEETLKRIGECVGQVHGKEMKSLVASGVEFQMTQPTYPSGNTATEEAKVIASKEYDYI